MDPRLAPRRDVHWQIHAPTPRATMVGPSSQFEAGLDVLTLSPSGWLGHCPFSGENGRKKKIAGSALAGSVETRNQRVYVFVRATRTRCLYTESRFDEHARHYCTRGGRRPVRFRPAASPASVYCPPFYPQPGRACLQPRPAQRPSSEAALRFPFLARACAPAAFEEVVARCLAAPAPVRVVH